MLPRLSVCGLLDSATTLRQHGWSRLEVIVRSCVTVNITKKLPTGGLGIFLPLSETTSSSFGAESSRDPNVVFDRRRRELVGEGDRSISFSLLPSFDASLDPVEVASSVLAVGFAGPPNNGIHSL